MKMPLAVLLLGVASLFTESAAQAQASLIQNAPAHRVLSLNGSWNSIIDPYENGFYNYRRDAFDQRATPVIVKPARWARRLPGIETLSGWGRTSPPND